MSGTFLIVQPNVVEFLALLNSRQPVAGYEPRYLLLDVSWTVLSAWARSF
jgi:hypothetical protein